MRYCGCARWPRACSRTWTHSSTPCATPPAGTTTRSKTLNDRFGHPAGDKVLRATARLLAATVRCADLVARTGGEEFTVLLPGANATQGLAVADKLRLAVQDTDFRYRVEPVGITVSCGVAGRTDADTPEALFERADAALYRAKEQGRNRCVLVAAG